MLATSLTVHPFILYWIVLPCYTVSITDSIMNSMSMLVWIKNHWNVYFWLSVSQFKSSELSWVRNVAEVIFHELLFKTEQKDKICGQLPYNCHLYPVLLDRIQIFEVCLTWIKRGYPGLSWQDYLKVQAQLLIINNSSA